MLQTRTSGLPHGRLLLLSAVLAATALAIGLAAQPAGAGTGGVDPNGENSKTQKGKGGKGDRNLTPRKYRRHWKRVTRHNKRWARRVAECESGRDPNATALGGEYRGAFMFHRQTWRTAPKTPGGDTIDYSYKTQAVVAVALKKQLGTKPWPVCG